MHPSRDSRVVDLSTWIAGAYCSKLLADGGAEVIKVEAADGDALRRWTASGAPLEPGSDRRAVQLCEHVETQRRGHRRHRRRSLSSLYELLGSADAVVWSAGSEVAGHPTLSPAEILRRHSRLVVTSITPFGLDGPWSSRAATKFTLQAWAGGIVGLARGRPDRPPVYVGGQIGEWLSGVFAAIGTLAALRRVEAAGELVDVSMLEVLATCLTYYPVSFMTSSDARCGTPRRFVPTPSVGAASDGLVGMGVGTGQQWLDFCTMVGHPEWTEDPKLLLDRTTLAPTIDEWVSERTVNDVLDLASALRIPDTPIANGANIRDAASTLPRQSAAPSSGPETARRTPARP